MRKDVIHAEVHCKVKDSILMENKKESILFIIISFVLSWGSWGVLIFLNIPAKENSLSTMLYILGGFSPTIVALLMPLFAQKGLRRAYYRRYFNFRISVKWYLASIIPAVLITSLTYGFVFLFKPEIIQSMAIQPFYMVVPFFFSMIIGGGLEEIGWRGILVHNARKNNLVLISILVGIIWGIWHAPLFFIQGVSQFQTDFVPFFISVIGYSFILTSLNQVTRSIAPCIIFHALYNAFAEMGFHSNETSMPESIITLVIAICFYVFINRINNKQKIDSCRNALKNSREEKLIN